MHSRNKGPELWECPLLRALPGVLPNIMGKGETIPWHFDSCHFLLYMTKFTSIINKSNID